MHHAHRQRYGEHRDVELRERIKPLKVAGDTSSVKNLVELRHTFDASPDAGSDLYVQATASVPAAIDP